MTVVDGEGGMFTPDALDAAIREAAPGDRYAPRPRLVCVEQPTNMGGGRVWPLEQVGPCSTSRARTGCARTSTAHGS